MPYAGFDGGAGFAYMAPPPEFLHLQAMQTAMHFGGSGGGAPLPPMASHTGIVPLHRDVPSAGDDGGRRRDVRDPATKVFVGGIAWKVRPRGGGNFHSRK